MIYRSRHIEKKLREYAAFFKVVLVTGARQVGKSTLLQRVFPNLKMIVFDPIQDLYNARRDPDLFLDNFPPPVILDEVQFAPEILPALKRRVDLSENPGQYFLTGSQNLNVLRSVAESMAGRVGILHLEGMTPLEMAGRGDKEGWLKDFLEDPPRLLETRQTSRGRAFDDPPPLPLARFLWRGSMPGLLDAPDTMAPAFFRSYLQTYIERDARMLGGIRDLADFDRFLALLAALTSQEINTAQLGREIGIAPSTANAWLDVLTNSYQWLAIAPYSGNAIKRLSGRRKGHLRDTGLACHLQRISSHEALLASPLFGAMFETFVINYVYRQFVTLSTAPEMYHWRTTGGAEVDLVLERDGFLYPIEAKCASNLSGHDTRGLRAFRQSYPEGKVRTGLIVYAGREAYRAEEHTIALPWSWLA